MTSTLSDETRRRLGLGLLRRTKPRNRRRRFLSRMAWLIIVVIIAPADFKTIH